MATKKTSPKPPVVKKATAGKQPRARKLPNEVRHSGRFITCSGPDLTLQGLTPTVRRQHHIVEISGPSSGKCSSTEPSVLTFKTAAQARRFFDAQLTAGTDDDETPEYLNAGGRTEWHGPSIDARAL